MSLDELRSLDEEKGCLDQFVCALPHIESLKQTVVDMMNASKELESKRIILALDDSVSYSI